LILVHQVAMINSIGQPAAELMRVRMLFKLIAYQPKYDVIIKVTVIVQPSSFINLMPQRTTDGIVFSIMLDRPDKFSKHEAIGSFLEMFPEGPPAEVIHLFQH